VLASQQGIDIDVYHIVGDKILPRPGPFKRDAIFISNPTSDGEINLAARPTDEANAPVDFIEARWHLQISGLPPETYFPMAKTYMAEMDYVQAHEWALKASESGDKRAYALLGFLSYHGLGTKKDEATAHRWYRKAAKAGDAESQSITGYDYLVGCGAPKNLYLSYFWSSLAITSGYESAAQNLSLAQKGLSLSEIERVTRHLRRFAQAFSQR
jgi:hypothetical protein